MALFLQAVVSGVLAGAVYGLLGLGLSLAYKTTGIINIAHGQIAIFGAYVAYTMSSHGVPIILDAIGGVIAAGVITAVMERAVFSPVYGRGVIAPILISIGVATVLQSVTQLIWGSQPLNLPPIASNNVWHLGGVTLTPEGLTILLVSAVAGFGMALAVDRTRTGRAMRACAQDSEVVSLLGIPAQRLYLTSFIAAGATAGLAGVLIAPTVGLLPSNGIILTIPGFAAAVLGGMGSLPGAMAGGILIGVLHNLASVYISGSYADVVEYLAIGVVLLVSTRGLFGDNLESLRRV